MRVSRVKSLTAHHLQSETKGSRPYICMQAALFLRPQPVRAAPGRHTCTKFRGCSRSRADRRALSHAQRYYPEWLLWLKMHGAHGRRACACSSKKTLDVLEGALTFAQGLPVVLHRNCLQLGRDPLPLCIGNTCELFHGRFMPLFCMAMAWSSAHTAFALS